MPWGLLKDAAAASPSSKPRLPLPMVLCSVPSASAAMTMRLWPESAMKSRPDAASASTLPGKESMAEGGAPLSGVRRSGVRSEPARCAELP